MTFDWKHMSSIMMLSRWKLCTYPASALKVLAGSRVINHGQWNVWPLSCWRGCGCAMVSLSFLPLHGDWTPDLLYPPQWLVSFTGLQLRKSEQNSFHDNFWFLNLWCDPHWNRLSETIPMSGNIIGFGWEIRKLVFWKLSILVALICCPA